MYLTVKICNYKKSCLQVCNFLTYTYTTHFLLFTIIFLFWTFCCHVVSLLLLGPSHWLPNPCFATNFCILKYRCQEDQWVNNKSHWPQIHHTSNIVRADTRVIVFEQWNKQSDTREIVNYHFSKSLNKQIHLYRTCWTSCGWGKHTNLTHNKYRTIYVPQ